MTQTPAAEPATAGNANPAAEPAAAGTLATDPASAGARSHSGALRAVPIEDRVWLVAALRDALQGGCPVFPVAPDTPEDEVRRLQAATLPEGTALVIRTSGSSGVPKAVALSAAALQASAEATHDALGGPGQWLIPLPANLISGVQMLVRSAHSGIDPVFFDGRFEARALLDHAHLMGDGRRYVSLVPVQLARLIELAEESAEAAEVLSRFDALLVGGQALSVPLRQRAHELGLNLVRSYGMTETAGGCVYDGVEIGDTRVRIRDGEVQLAGSHLALGYVDAPQLTDERFVVDQDTRWYRTGDAGELLGGMLTVTGRLDRVIISGGVNVSLDEVERVAGEVPGWQGALAAAVPDPEWGERPVLVREAAGRHGAATPFSEVQEAIRTELGRAAVPDAVIVRDEMPRLGGGKPDRLAVDRLVADARKEPR